MWNIIGRRPLKVLPYNLIDIDTTFVLYYFMACAIRAERLKDARGEDNSP
jgi:hypothetical protein